MDEIEFSFGLYVAEEITNSFYDVITNAEMSAARSHL